ncbi:hypothetical protein [Cesiribacter sp. SM1]|uniref:hypothetical protein n=1 Tax=Cesiribacter sp. SM1 TaxID=2861196 RepID=UPI001CD74716|nr:hypothetical protein [Cesiribacter sp. SM1]
MGDEFNNPGAWEDAWQQAFEDSEHTPPKKVWQGLENSLMEQQLRRYKRKLFVYQWLAAASVLFLGLWAGWWLLLEKPQNEQDQLSAENTSQSVTAPVSADFTEENTSAEGAVNNRQNVIRGAEQESASANSTSAAGISDYIGLPFSGIAYSPGGSVVGRSDLFSPYQPVVGIIDYASFGTGAYTASPEEEETPVILLSEPQISALEARLKLKDGLLRKEIRVVAASRKRPEKQSVSLMNGNVWLGASLSTTFFDPNMRTEERYNLSSWAESPPAGKGGKEVYTANVSTWDEREKSLPSIDFQLDAGFRLSPKWMLQSSLQYGTYKVNTLGGTFTDANDQKSYPLYYSNFSYERLQVVNARSRSAMPVDALNTYRFFSVPLTVSYVLTERTVGFAVRTGVSSDFFLGGEINDEDNRLSEYSIEAGPGSPFQRVHFNALFGAQLFYRAGPNYLITLEPTYRYAISDFNKKTSFFNSRPTQLGIAAGFRFILR